jgi:hypothetical protein
MGIRTVLFAHAMIAGLILTGCGIHEARLINNLKDGKGPRYAEVGLIAFEFETPKSMQVEFWAVDEEKKQSYQIDQAIDWPPGQLGAEALTPAGLGRYWLNVPPWVYVYEVPAGRYRLRHLRINGEDKKQIHLDIRTEAVPVDPGSITYIGSFRLKGDWGTFDLGLNPHYEIESSDRSAEVFAKLDGIERHGIRTLPKRTHLLALKE